MECYLCLSQPHSQSMHQHPFLAINTKICRNPPFLREFFLASNNFLMKNLRKNYCQLKTQHFIHCHTSYYYSSTENIIKTNCNKHSSVVYDKPINIEYCNNKSSIKQIPLSPNDSLSSYCDKGTTFFDATEKIKNTKNDDDS